MRVLYVGLAALLAVSGCKGGEKGADTAVEAATPAADRARSAAATADAIAANPSAADSILGAAGFTRDSFDKLMFEIAADSAMSAAYAGAKTR